MDNHYSILKTTHAIQSAVQATSVYMAFASVRIVHGSIAVELQISLCVDLLGTRITTCVSWKERNVNLLTK